MPGKISLPRRLGRYVIEIIIITIGITLSFALNDWDKQKSEHEDYQIYLENLKQDIKIDSVQMANDYASYFRKVNGVKDLLKYQNSRELDTIIVLVRAFRALNNYVEFLPNNNTFLMLSSTGDFKVFENKRLVSELIQLYQYDYAYIEMLGKEANHDRINHLEPFVLEHAFLEDEQTFPKMKTDLNKIIKDRKFRNICLIYQGSSRNAMTSYQRAMNRLRNVDSLIHVELAKF